MEWRQNVKRLLGTKELAPFGELKAGLCSFSAVAQRRIVHTEAAGVSRVQITLIGVFRISCFSLS